MKFSEIASKTKDELEKIFIDLKKEMYNMRVLLANGEQKNPARARQIRKDIARILTFINQKKGSK